MTVPADQTLISHGLWGADDKNLAFAGGTQVLHGYLWSRRDTRRRHYELWDPAFVQAHSRRQDVAGVRWDGFPHVYFPSSMLLHVDFHLQPVVAATRGGGRYSTWCELSVEDMDIIMGAVMD